MAAFTRVAEQSNLVSFQHGIGHGLTEQHTVSHVLQQGSRAGAVLETNAVTDLLTEGHVHLFGHALSDGHGGHPSRLRARDRLLADLLGVLDAPLRDLGRLAGTGFADETDGLVFGQELEELVLVFPDRESDALSEQLEVPGGVGGRVVRVDLEAGFDGGASARGQRSGDAFVLRLFGPEAVADIEASLL